ncbi:hypothetical protein BKK79_36030 [Cupriavidus sp. USMAA2-4]|uniref:DUF1488 family protein n=1 Tax=Cupriavidus sp. USMAA2-4 TaxID=876364 RepID=UPI0008A6B825|nr:DUF1488 family protein [Cupriavidus sp. USMAA2-4]AOY94319.1 hypothetical protein BKK79_20325 [Cupriavidus sp. USMAA2-4]AOY96903.1 hypothetical protein BKK79_36030 [Cupriavidus sp. USMAA2-4]
MTATIAPGTQPVTDGVTMTVAFSVADAGAVQHFGISYEALRDHFGAASNEPRDISAAFERGKAAIVGKAANMMRAGQRSTSRILLKTENF